MYLIFGLTLTLVLSAALRLMNLGYSRRHANIIPAGFEASLDANTLTKMSVYAYDTARLALVNDVFFRLLVIIALPLGFFSAYDSWIAGLTQSFVWQGTWYVLVLSWALGLVSLPFDLYENFVVEARHGFNHSTAKLFWLDFAKSKIIGSILLAVVAILGLSIVKWSGSYWWLLVWGFLLAFQLLITLIAPKVIEPLFVKMTPLTSDELQQQILALTSKAGVRVDRIFQVDASRRSGHTNAYFSGIGPVKRVVLFDTLLARLSTAEIIAVLAHELGHWRHRHVLKRIISGQAIMLLACGGAAYLINWDGLPSLANATHASFFLRLTIALLIGSILEFFLAPLMNRWSRVHEWQADAFATQHVPAVDLQMALIKLAKDNLANLHAHPVYVAYHASHPTLPARVARLRSVDAAQDQLERAGAAP
jgi:STE24 endopeptidase